MHHTIFRDYSKTEGSLGIAMAETGVHRIEEARSTLPNTSIKGKETGCPDLARNAKESGRHHLGAGSNNGPRSLMTTSLYARAGVVNSTVSVRLFR